MRTYGIICLSLVALVGSYACGSSNGTVGSSQGGTNSGFALNDAGVIYKGGTQPITVEQYVALTSEACSRWSRQGESVPTEIQFVVDVSGSMLSTAPTTGDRPKWDITRAALAEAIDAMPSTTRVGMLFFPNQNTTPNTTGEPRPVDTCVNVDAMIPLDTLGPAGSPQRNAIAAGLQAAAPAGGTPTHDAYDYALQYGLVPSNPPGHRYMVLITDGQPTMEMGCIGTGQTKYPVDYHPIVAQITSAHGEGVNTFVIGAPGSEMNDQTSEDVRYWLSEAARAGGSAVSPECSDTGTPGYCHFDMSTEPDFAVGFGKALASIAAQVASCSYKLPQPPAGQTLDVDKINVILTKGTSEYYLVLRAAESDCTSGWYLDSQGNIALCSETCQQVRQDELYSLELRFGCATVVGPLT